jgi:hypothetical protein
MNKDFNKLFNKNRLTLDNLNDLDQNMGQLLDKKSIITYKNCNKINLNINSKINHLYIKNCKNMNIKIKSLINGFKIDNCLNIILDLYDCDNIIEITINNSNDIKLKMKKKNMDTQFIDIVNSKKISFKLK